MPLTWNAVYLGKIAARIDVVEDDGETSENAAVLVGETFGSGGDPLWQHVTEVTSINNSGQSEMLDSDNLYFNDELQFDAGDGNGVQTNVFDGAALYNATLTYTNGNTATLTAVIMQDVDGNLFLAPEYFTNADIDVLEAEAIQSISLDSLDSTNGEVTASRIATNFVCFATGTMIGTLAGERRVETLEPGDMILTADNGPRPLLWRGVRSLNLRLAAFQKQKPVELKPGSLAIGLPRRPLIVSPQHRILLNADGKEVLAPALGLLGAKGVRRMEGRRSVCYHVLFMQRHEIIFAEGAMVESFYPGPCAMEVLSPLERLTLIVGRPGLLTDPVKAYGPYARPVLRRREAEAIAQAQKDFQIPCQAIVA